MSAAETITMPGETAALAVDSEPKVLDTYALVYSFALVALLPGMYFLQYLPFRTYTFSYVALATLPFVIGIVATFLTDSSDGLRRSLLRTAILTPIIVVTGVGVLFTSSLLLLPLNQWMSPENFNWLGPGAMGVLAVLVLPLPMALVRRVRRPISAVSLVHIAFIVAALALVAGAMWATTQGILTRDLVRKDIVIYIVGAMTWYLPSFGITAGAWRRVGLV